MPSTPQPSMLSRLLRRLLAKRLGIDTAQQHVDHQLAAIVGTEAAQNEALKHTLERLTTVEAELKLTQDALLAQGRIILAHKDVLMRWATESATLREIEDKHAKQQRREQAAMEEALGVSEDGVMRLETRMERRARRSREHQARVAAAEAKLLSEGIEPTPADPVQEGPLADNPPEDGMRHPLLMDAEYVMADDSEATQS